MRRLLAVVLGGSLATGCVDFVFPNIPGIEDRGGPVRFNGHVVVTDSGRVSANATLRPGLDIDGYKRPVTMPFLRVMDDVLEPDSVLRDGTRRYRASWERGADVMAGPLTLVAPRVEGVQGAPPGVEWFGLRRAGPSSIRLSEGEDLLLPIIEVEGTTGHPPPVRQWFLTLSSGDRSYRVSSNGMPPIPVSVPPRWIPEGDTVRVRLIFSQSAVLTEPPGDYVGAVTIDSWFLWTVVVEPPVTARGVRAVGTPRAGIPDCPVSDLGYEPRLEHIPPSRGAIWVAGKASPRDEHGRPRRGRHGSPCTVVRCKRQARSQADDPRPRGLLPCSAAFCSHGHGVGTHARYGTRTGRDASPEPDPGPPAGGIAPGQQAAIAVGIPGHTLDEWDCVAEKCPCVTPSGTIRTVLSIGRYAT